MPRTSVPIGVVEAFMRRFRGVPVKLTPLVHGEESQAYAFVEQGRELVLRVSRPKEGFEKDALAYRNFGRPDLPIPRVIEIGNLDGCHAFCISPRVSGTTLQDLSPEEIGNTLEATVDVMHTIERSDIVKIDGFGRFDGQGIGGYRNWRDYLTSVSDPKLYDWASIATVVGEDRIAPLLTRVLALAEGCPEVRRLVHGDFGSNNVFSDNHHITGVIDWSEAMVGDPLYDAANIFFWRTWLDCMEQLAHFLDGRLDHDEDTMTRLLCYQLHIGLREIYSSAKAGKTTTASWALGRAEDIMRQR